MNAKKLSNVVEEFLALKRTMAESGANFSRVDRNQLNHSEKLLRDFFGFWQEHGCPWPIRATFVLDWVAVGAKSQHPYRDLRRLYVMRAFLKQVRVLEPETEIPENIFRTGCGRRTPHIFSDQDIEEMLKATKQPALRNSLCPLTHYTLIGLLVSTGLRIGEAIRLKIVDAQLDEAPPHLLIRDTKFGKSRHVVLHASTAQYLRNYCTQRAIVLRGRCAETFFINRFGRSLEYNSIRQAFLNLLKRAGIQSIPGQRAPSLHSFRHTFAVKRLTQWHLDRRDVQELLPHLAVYLGHTGPENTYWYLTATPELLQTAAALFDHHLRQGGINL
jgi:integrase/recombinase XerD